MRLHFELNDGASVDLHSYMYGKFLMLSKNKRCLSIERVDKLTDEAILQLALKMVADYEQSTGAMQTPCYLCTARHAAYTSIQPADS